MTPQRIQRKRSKGWKMPENTVYVGRPTQWGNPYHLKDGLCTSNADARRFYRAFVASGTCYVSDQTPPTIEKIRIELAGKNLACWCPLDQPCHADVLLELANQPEI